MKSTFIYFGILGAMFSNSVFANDLSKEQNHAESNSAVTNTKTFKKPALDFESDTLITMTSLYKKTIEEVIAEDNKIIESNLENNITSAVDNTLEIIINEDNQIIESNLTKEVFPLDFDKLNKA